MSSRQRLRLDESVNPDQTQFPHTCYSEAGCGALVLIASYDDLW
jgi:hypothetical protein